MPEDIALNPEIRIIRSANQRYTLWRTGADSFCLFLIPGEPIFVRGDALTDWFLSLTRNRRRRRKAA